MAHRPYAVFEAVRLGLRPESRLDRAVLAGVLAATLGGVLFALLAPLADLTFRSTDDSYYYFGVARNVALGYGPTFDRLHPTNGFHPLWMACLLPVAALAGGGLEETLRLSFVLVALVAGAVLWVAYAAIASYAGRAAGIVALVLLTAPPFLNPIICGLETGLLLLVLFTLFWAARRYNLLSVGAGARRDLALGALLGLMMLARLDSVFVALAVYAAPAAAWIMARGQRPPAWLLVVKLARVGTVTLALLAPYFLWNALAFGHLMPVSGALKTSFPEVTVRLRRITGYHAHYGQALLATATAALGWLTWQRRRRPAGRGRPETSTPAPGSGLFLAAVWFGCALHFLNTLLFMEFGVHWWHFSLYAPLALTAACLAAGPAVARLRRPAPAAAALGALALLFSAATHVVDARRRGEDHEVWLQAALWAREHLPRDAVVGMTDCGLFGYLSDRRTVNLDGVINGYSYQEALHRGRLGLFLDEAGMTHVAASAARYVNGGYAMWLPARLHRSPGALLVGLEGKETYRSRRYRDVQFLIWERDAVRVFDRVTDPRAASYLGR